MPSVRERFKTYHDFASASLDEIYGERLKEAYQYEMTTSESGIFVNDGKGKFSFQPLPPEAQLAPVRGIAVTHFDGDGQPDIVLAQNFYDNQRETGRMNGGLCLALVRKSDGGFYPLPPSVSGLAVAGNARSLTTPDLNGDHKPDLCLYHNAAKPRFFLNQAPGKFISVVLKAKSGNHRGIGSRLTWVHADGEKGISEITSGSGYLSQGPTVIHYAVSKDNPLRSIRVHWPDGSSSESTVPADSVRLEIRQ